MCMHTNFTILITHIHYIAAWYPDSTLVHVDPLCRDAAMKLTEESDNLFGRTAALLL